VEPMLNVAIGTGGGGANRGSSDCSSVCRVWVDVVLMYSAWGTTNVRMLKRRSGAMRRAGAYMASSGLDIRGSAGESVARRLGLVFCRGPELVLPEEEEGRDHEREGIRANDANDGNDDGGDVDGWTGVLGVLGDGKDVHDHISPSTNLFWTKLTCFHFTVFAVPGKVKSSDPPPSNVLERFTTWLYFRTCPRKVNT